LVKEKGKVKSSDLLEMLGIGETRAKILLRDLVAEGVLISVGKNRNRVYKKQK